MSNKHWTGEEEMHKALQELLEYQSNVPTSKIRNVVSIANRHVADFKMIVYEIEKFIRKSDDNHKIAGLFVIDSLCKQHSKEKELFGKRFALRLKDTFSHFSKLGDKDKSTMMRIVDEWRKKEIFPPDVISSILNDNGISLSVGYLEVTEKKIEDSNIPLKRKFLEIKKASRLCPFKESCIFGEKCKFSHNDTNSLDHYAIRICKSGREKIYDLDERLERDTRRNSDWLENATSLELTSTRIISFSERTDFPLYSVEVKAFPSCL